MNFFLAPHPRRTQIYHYMTPTHTRNRAYRNLYRAIPVARKTETASAWETETKNLVDQAYQAFWKRRGVKAPWVSPNELGVYETKKEEYSK